MERKRIVGNGNAIIYSTSTLNFNTNRVYSATDKVSEVRNHRGPPTAVRFAEALDDCMILWHYHIGMRLLAIAEKESGNA